MGIWDIYDEYPLVYHPIFIQYSKVELLVNQSMGIWDICGPHDLVHGRAFPSFPAAQFPAPPWSFFAEAGGACSGFSRPLETFKGGTPKWKVSMDLTLW